MFDTDFDCEEIEKAFPGYKYVKSLGRGAFGKVYLVTDKATQEQLAVKKISCFGMCEYERKNAVNEVRMLASLDHPHIVKFVSGMFDNNEDDLYLFMEYAPYGDLANLIEQAKDKKKCIPENTIWQILLHVSEGLQFLHKNNIIHRDIKPANIFRAADGSYKIGDLNVSKIIANGDLAKTKAGSPLYTCPQVWLKEEGYNEKCDVWSLGIVIYELCCLKVPYEANTIDELIRKQKNIKLKKIPRCYSQNLNELIFEMLQYFPKRRISAEKVRLTCLKNLKIEQEDILQPLDPLMETIVIPETPEQRWINLVPLPPKVRRESYCQKRDSKEKSSGDVLMGNRSNIFSSLENRSVLVPKRKNSQERLARVRLPSIQRKGSFNEIENRPSREKSRDKSREKSKEKSVEATHGQTPDKGQPRTNRSRRKA